MTAAALTTPDQPVALDSASGPSDGPATTATPPRSWFVYLIECAGGSVYTGISPDVAARYARHVCGKGARYTRARPPLRLLGSIACADRSAALRAEIAIKRLPADRKRALFSAAASATSESDTAAPAGHGCTQVSTARK